MTMFSKMILPSRLLSLVLGKTGQSCSVKSLVSTTTTPIISKGVHNYGGSLLFSVPVRGFSVTSKRCDLMEFFDEKDNWGEKEIRVGRSWKTDELRLKSNTDLHKLWYVLLKERNMLKTMEHDAKQECRLFPNPERIDKVEESMKHLEEVVRERNKAYFLLETGTTGERSGEEFENWLGLPEYRQYEEHPVPPEENKQWHLAQKEIPTSSRKEKQMFYSMLRQKQRRQARRLRRLYDFQILSILTKFPNCDLDALKAQYPDVPGTDIDRYKKRIDTQINENVEVGYTLHRWKGKIPLKKPRTWKYLYRQ